MATLAEVIRLIPQGKQQNARSWGAYTLLWLPLAANGASVAASVTTQDDSDFIVMRAKATVTDTATPPVENATPQATITLQIGGVVLFPDGNPVHIQQLAVSAADRRGHELEFPQLIAPQTTLQAKATNLTATAMNIRIVLFGLRVFNFARASNTL
jgi:hypothetical protein